MVAIFPRSQLKIEGNLAVFEDRGTSGQTVFRNFCPNCGSPVMTDTERAREQGLIFIKAGTFDDVSDLNPTAHYWTKRAHHWLALPDGAQLVDQE